MTKEQLIDMAAEAYNRLGKNPPPYQWMDGYVAGYVAHQQNLQQCNVSGTLPLVEILDMLNKAHEALAKSEISQDEYSPISWALIDAKKRLGVLLSGNDR